MWKTSAITMLDVSKMIRVSTNAFATLVLKETAFIADLHQVFSQCLKFLSDMHFCGF